MARGKREGEGDTHSRAHTCVGRLFTFIVLSRKSYVEDSDSRKRRYWCHDNSVNSFLIIIK